MSSSTITLEKLYVIDTHVLIWYLTDATKLTKPAMEILDAAQRGETLIIIPAIVIAEMYFANVKKRLFEDFAATLHNLQNAASFYFVEFHAADVIDFDRDATIPEMHDRIIAGLARRLNAPLLSNDLIIRAAALVKVIWD